MTLMAEPKNGQGATESGAAAVNLATAIDAIQAAYRDIDGQMIVRQVSKSSDTTWYRVNWYKKGDFGMFVHHSRFLALKRTNGGLVVEDQTIRPRVAESSVN